MEKNLYFEVFVGVEKQDQLVILEVFDKENLLYLRNQ